MKEKESVPKKAAIPPCLASMGCLCAGHMRGNAADAPCDTTEVPAAEGKNESDWEEFNLFLTSATVEKLKQQLAETDIAMHDLSVERALVLVELAKRGAVRIRTEVGPRERGVSRVEFNPMFAEAQASAEFATPRRKRKPRR